MNKGKVIDIQKKYLVVLNDQMAYEKIEKKNGLSLGKEIYYFEEDRYKESKQPVKKYFLVAAVLFMMLFIQPLLVAEEAYGYISVDINPSIELQVNKGLQVLSIEAINEDAKTYIKEEWIGKQAKEVIDLIIEETQRKGVLNTERNFVLVSYYFNDEDPTSEEVFIQSLDELFNEKPHDYEVAVIKSNGETYSEAKEANESLGKQVVNKKMNTKVEDLLAAKASIEKDEDFKIYKKDLEVVSDDEDDEGEEKNASKGVIGRKAAEGFAFDHIGGEGQIVDFKFDNDDDKKYAFEIAHDGKVYAIEINAFNGQLIDYSVDEEDDIIDDEKGNSKGVIGRNTAVKIAFERIGMAGKIIYFDFERDDDSAEYAFEIAADGKVYEIKINGFTGEVLEYKIEAQDKNDDDDDDEDKEKGHDSSRSVIGKKSAENIAFEIIGGEGKIIDFDFDKDEDSEYAFEIQFNDQLHEIKINGFTGKEIEYEIKDKDAEDDEDDEKGQDSRDVIGRKIAEEKAFEVIGGEGKIINFDFDKDEDTAEYIFEIAFNDQTYEIKINGFTGEVIEHVVEDQDGDDEDEENTLEGNSNKENEILLREEIEIIALELVSGEIVEIFIEEDEILEYLVLVQDEDYMHELIINGFTGDIIEHEKELIDDDEDESDDVSGGEEDVIDTKEDED